MEASTVPKEHPVYRIFAIVIGAALGLQAVSSFVLHDGFDYSSGLVWIGDLVPDLIELVGGFTVAILAARRQLKLVPVFFLITALSIPVIGGVAYGIDTAINYPDDLSVGWFVEIIPMTRPFIYGPWGFDGVIYFLNNVYYGLVFWGSIAMGIIGCVLARKSARVTRVDSVGP